MVKARKVESELQDSAEVGHVLDGGKRAQWLQCLGHGWYSALEAELRRPSIEQAIRDANAARETHVVLPPAEAMFRAFTETPLDTVRVVIVGQEPHHGQGQAMGLSFSVPRGVSVPPSLQNILKEAGAWPSTHGDLTSWAKQGVFLLNSSLTVVEAKPLSHQNLGWERFTDAVIRAINRERKGVIFLLWGEAQAKAKFVDTGRHFVLTAGNPSPLSYEKVFKRCGHFKKVNELLCAQGEQEITWKIPV